MLPVARWTFRSLTITIPCFSVRSINQSITIYLLSIHIRCLFTFSFLTLSLSFDISLLCTYLPIISTTASPISANTNGQCSAYSYAALWYPKCTQVRWQDAISRLNNNLERRRDKGMKPLVGILTRLIISRTVVKVLLGRSSRTKKWEICR